MAPSDEQECNSMLYTGYLHNGPAIVRYPRGEGLGVEVNDNFKSLDIGRSKKIKDGEKFQFFPLGLFWIYVRMLLMNLMLH